MMVTYQVEDWFECWEEMSVLWDAHWQEVALDREKIRLAPDFASYERFAQDGSLHVVTAREDGKIIGYHISIVKPHLHYKDSLSAFTDVYFIHPDHRKGMVGVKLFKETEKSLKARGVQKMFTGTKLSLDMGRIFERLGWRETERLYTKYIGD